MIGWQKRYGHFVLKEIPGCQQFIYQKKNEADYISRLFNDNSEWKLDPQIFQKILMKLFYIKLEIDILLPI